MIDGPKITVYSAEKSDNLFGLAVDSIKGFRDGFALGLQMAKRDLRAAYRQSILGFAWAIFTPVAQTLVWVFLSSRGVLNIGDTGVPYPVYVLTGIMLWQTFVECLNAPLANFNLSKSVLRKININKESIIIAGLLKVFFNFGIKLLVLIPLFIYYKVALGTPALLFPVGFALMIGFGTVVGIWLTPIGALFTDVSRFVQSFIQLLFFLTPIIYPARDSGMLGLIDKFNPLAITVTTTRDLLIGLHVGDWTPFLILSGLVLVFGLLGLVLYKISLPIIVERMGS